MSTHTLPEKRFCKYCGKPLENKVSEYDEYTGQPVKSFLQCSYASCRDVQSRMDFWDKHNPYR